MLPWKLAVEEMVMWEENQHACSPSMLRPNGQTGETRQLEHY